MAAGTGKEEFFRRMNLALGGAQTASQAATANPIQTTPDRSQAPPISLLSTPSDSHLPARAAVVAPTSLPSESRAAEDTADEKRARLEAQKKALQAKDEARRAAEIRARRDEIEGVASRSSADKKYAM